MQKSAFTVCLLDQRMSVKMISLMAAQDDLLYSSWRMDPFENHVDTFFNACIQNEKKQYHGMDGSDT